MERKHADRLRDKFPGELGGKRVITLRVPDNYKFMDPELVELLKDALSSHLPD
jgi:predicted protein tyrosine phosphatase